MQTFGANAGDSDAPRCISIAGQLVGKGWHGIACNTPQKKISFSRAGRRRKEVARRVLNESRREPFTIRVDSSFQVFTASRQGDSGHSGHILAGKCADRRIASQLEGPHDGFGANLRLAVFASSSPNAGGRCRHMPMMCQTTGKYPH